jgi:hypothetical protein
MGAFAGMDLFWAIFFMTEDRETNIYSNTLVFLVGTAPEYFYYLGYWQKGVGHARKADAAT